jgi:acyl-CoA synthetase (AMP-forming)/AMP-acid ligase II
LIRARKQARKGTDAKLGGEPKLAEHRKSEGKPEASTTADKIITFGREHLPHFKVPRTALFVSLPKTSTGEIQKFVLRERAKAVAKQP